MHCKLGATREGKLVAAEVRIVADGGAYCYTTNKVLGNATMTCTGPYDIPNVKVDVDGVYTNNLPSGAFRGFGAPQAIFAAETQMNKLAQALGMDPVELRLKNLLREGSLTPMGTPLPGGVSLVEVTEKCARAAGWQHKDPWVFRKPRRVSMVEAPASPSLSRTLAFRLATRRTAGPRSNCGAKKRSEEALVYIGSAEVGQGTHTVIQQMAAEALNLPPERVQVIASDTATSPGSSGSVSASRMTFMAGNAVQGAAAAALERWRAEERPAVAEHTYLAPKTTPFDPETGHGTPNFAYGYVAQAVEVEVDTETGELRILRVVCADDVGQAINPAERRRADRGRHSAGSGLGHVRELYRRGGARADALISAPT